MHAECNIVLPVLSVCLSVYPMLVLCLNEQMYCHTFWRSGRGIILFFSAHCHYKIPRGNTSLEAFNTMAMNKFY